jgi:glycosyltransferase involved in cell wall biosynthesis
LGVGGAEKQVIALAERMSAKGHSVALVVLKHAEEECPVKLPVLRLNLRKTPMGVLRGLGFAHKFLLLFRPDILHSHTFPANIFARLLRVSLHIKVSMRGTVPVVINTIHNVYEGAWHRMLLYRITGAQADAVTAVSSAAAERFIQLGAVPRSKISVLTNGVDLDSFTPDSKARRTKRAEMHAGGAFVWLAVGRIVPAKAYPNLLRAFAQVQRAHATVTLWIAGEGRTDSFDDDSNQRGQVKAVNIQWLGLRRDIASLLDAADGYVLSSAWEGMPLAVGEAMAMEKPVVATDVGGVRELVGDAGIIVPPADGEALANAMLEVMAMTEKQRKAMGRTTRERITQHFSIEAKAEEWEQMYLRFKRQETM